MYNRLPFGVAAAPAIFQRTMETILQGLPGVCVYLDGILIMGKSNVEYLSNLSAVLCRLSTAGMKLKSDRCSFLLQEVEYLGHKITGKALYLQCKPYTTTNQCDSAKVILGMLNYYGKFLPNLSTCLTPLYKENMLL